MPVRVTDSTRFDVLSVMVAVGYWNCTVLSLSRIVTAVDIGATSVAPVAPESATVNERLAFTAGLSTMFTRMDLGPVSPSAQSSAPGVHWKCVPLTAVPLVQAKFTCTGPVEPDRLA